MRMVRLFLSDGSTQILTEDEMLLTPQGELKKLTGGKMIIKTEFFEEDGR